MVEVTSTSIVFCYLSKMHSDLDNCLMIAEPVIVYLAVVFGSSLDERLMRRPKGVFI